MPSAIARFYYVLVDIAVPACRIGERIHLYTARSGADNEAYQYSKRMPSPAMEVAYNAAVARTPTLTVKPCSQSSAFVYDFTTGNIDSGGHYVDISDVQDWKAMCTCGIPFAKRSPCSHVLAVCKFFGVGVISCS
jgi:hypothetical protein